jgi:hypothetical protein
VTCAHGNGYVSRMGIGRTLSERSKQYQHVKEQSIKPRIIETVAQIRFTQARRHAVDRFCGDRVPTDALKNVSCCVPILFKVDLSYLLGVLLRASDLIAQ